MRRNSGKTNFTRNQLQQKKRRIIPSEREECDAIPTQTKFLAIQQATPIIPAEGCYAIKPTYGSK